MTAPQPTPAPRPSPSIGILLCNLGTPDEPTPAAVRRYLAEFLGDPRVVEIPPLLWKPILHGIILRRRPAESARKYRSVWTEDGSPLLAYSQKQASLLRGWLGEAGLGPLQVALGMRYGSPGIVAQLETFRAQGIERVLVVPLYPQYSATTTASVLDQIHQWNMRQRNMLDLRIIKDYAAHPGYIAALARRTLEHWQTHGRPDKLVMSYHGIPQRNIDLGDPYQQRCLLTARLLAEQLGLRESQYRVTFQSRFGRAQWLQPYTQPTLEEEAHQGLQVVDVMCPGFASDCLETLEEINMEVREAFLHQGGKAFRYIPCLNDHPSWIDGLGDLVLENLGGWLPADAIARQPRGSRT
ncbi:ferrochelatase [Corticibacter populi]|uniref:Ferrochelatase n=1 Tax=Corticibacter populi TaxID=1550736 RepID=A0A3M6QXA3_9BURK|nr:ferrochelatase [Corticibacter populi]RMX07655.1 ferrochelatase [Corticibacter populi]RZS30159.1 ferrochelatase [Corticibacter populi]